MNDPLEWYYEIPVVSRFYLTGALLTTTACALDLVSPFSLYFNFNLIFFKGQVRWLLRCSYHCCCVWGRDSPRAWVVSCAGARRFGACSRRSSSSGSSASTSSSTCTLCILFHPCVCLWASGLHACAALDSFTWLRSWTPVLNRVRYCRLLEEGSFRGRTADFIYMILLGATAMIVRACLRVRVTPSPLTRSLLCLLGRCSSWRRS